jgi:hypothetical protein
LTACAPGSLASPEESRGEPAASPSPSQSAESAAPGSAVPSTPAAAPGEPSWSPLAVDTSGWQTFSMPGGEATFRLPASWEIRDLHAFDTTLEPPNSAGWAHVYDDAGEHVLGFHIEQEPWEFPCDGPESESEVLYEEPADVGVTTLRGGETVAQVRNDAGLAISMHIVDGWTPGAGCSLDNQVDMQPAASGVGTFSFGTGGPGPGIVTPPSFSGPFESSGTALDRIDPELLGTAWAIVTSLEIS